MCVLCVFWMDFLSIFGTGIYREEGKLCSTRKCRHAMGCHYLFHKKRLVSTRRRRRRRRRRSCALDVSPRFSRRLRRSRRRRGAKRPRRRRESLGAISRSSTAILKSFSVGGESVGTGENRGCRSLFSRCSVSVGFTTTSSSSSSSLVVSSSKRKKHFGPRSKTSTRAISNVSASLLLT